MKFIVQNRTLLTYGLTLVNLVAIVLFSLLATTSRIRNEGDYEDEIFQTIDLLDQVSLDLAKSEADVHNYILTSEKEYVDAYRNVRHPLEEKIESLEAAFSADSTQMKKFKMFRELIDKQMFVLESSIQLKKNNGIDTVTLFLQQKNKDRCMDQIKYLQEDLIEIQKAVMKKKQEQMAFSMKGREYIIVSASIASLLISIIAIGTIVTDLNDKREREKYLLAMNENKDKFFTLISHDLKGPAHNLISISEILLHDESLSEEERKTFLDHLNTTAKKNFNLLENLLEWSRIQMGTLTLDPQKCDLWEIIQETLLLADEKAFQKNISLKNNINRECLVLADFNSIKTVVRNLLINAIKFTPAGGAIFIDGSLRKDNFFVISVKDTGIGMDPEIKKNLFHPGKVVSRYGTQGETGTGLGLLLCKEFVERNKGKLWVESEPGQGTTFFFSLPVTF
jgi:two-component system, sensor histidine kinase and response regulator